MTCQLQVDRDEYERYMRGRGQAPQQQAGPPQQEPSEAAYSLAGIGAGLGAGVGAGAGAGAGMDMSTVSAAGVATGGETGPEVGAGVEPGADLDDGMDLTVAEPAPPEHG